MVFLNLAFPFPILLLLAVRKEIELGEVNAGSVPSFQRCPEGIGLNVKSGIGGKGDRPGIVEGGGCVGADHCIPGAADQAGTMGCVSADDRVQREGTQHRKEKANLKLRSLAKPETVVEDRTGGRGFIPRSEEHTSELQSLMRNSYAVFCLETKKYR